MGLLIIKCFVTIDHFSGKRLKNLVYFLKEVKKVAAYVYLLKCADETLYAGWTNDIEKRVDKHNQGLGAKYTRCRLPVSLVYWEELPDKSSALKREIALKKLTRKEKLALVENFDDEIEKRLPVEK